MKRLRGELPILIGLVALLQLGCGGKKTDTNMNDSVSLTTTPAPPRAPNTYSATVSVKCQAASYVGATVDSQLVSLDQAGETWKGTASVRAFPDSLTLAVSIKASNLAKYEGSLTINNISKPFDGFLPNKDLPEEYVTIKRFAWDDFKLPRVKPANLMPTP